MKKGIKAITREWNAMTAKLSSKKPNGVNCYICQDKKCSHITKTIDVDPGVTPMFFECEKCNEMAYSSGYEDIAPSNPITWEWYRPDLKKVLKIRNRNPAVLDHYLQGGLNYRRKIKIRS